LVKVATLDQPVAMAVRPGDDGIYVAEKGGRVRLVPKGQTTRPGAAQAEPVLDLTGQVSHALEQGLLGLAFSPDGGRLYVDYTDARGDTRVVEYRFADGRADPASRREVLAVHQPYENHNGGEVAFGPDGKLYVGLGDGGSERDPDNVGQDLRTPLAKILRIDPQPSAGRGYTIPPDNPFVTRSGARAETWEWGLRNPWRFSWDRKTGDLWIGDVGQDQWEEIDFVPTGRQAGANLGWSRTEGRHRFKGDNPAGALLPIAEYSHENGDCSVAGGYVYRGVALPDLQGSYIYGDSCTGRLWALVQQDGRVAAQRKLELPGADQTQSGQGFGIASFGEDRAGELYLLALAGGLFRFSP